MGSRSLRDRVCDHRLHGDRPAPDGDAVAGARAARSEGCPREHPGGVSAIPGRSAGLRDRGGAPADLRGRGDQVHQRHHQGQAARGTRFRRLRTRSAGGREPEGPRGQRRREARRQRRIHRQDRPRHLQPGRRHGSGRRRSVIRKGPDDRLRRRHDLQPDDRRPDPRGSGTRRHHRRERESRQRIQLRVSHAGEAGKLPGPRGRRARAAGRPGARRRPRPRPPLGGRRAHHVHRASRRLAGRRRISLRVDDGARYRPRLHRRRGDARAGAADGQRGDQDGGR